MALRKCRICIYRHDFLVHYIEAWIFYLNLRDCLPRSPRTLPLDLDSLLGCHCCLCHCQSHIPLCSSWPTACTCHCAWAQRRWWRDCHLAGCPWSSQAWAECCRDTRWGRAVGFLSPPLWRTHPLPPQHMCQTWELLNIWPLHLAMYYSYMDSNLICCFINMSHQSNLLKQYLKDNQCNSITIDTRHRDISDT